MSEIPIACTLSPADLEKRRADLLAGLVARAASRASTPDGCRFSFRPADGLLADLARTIDVERQCCRFLRFVLTVEPGAGAITLEVTGPAGTSLLLEQLGVV